MRAVAICLAAAVALLSSGRSLSAAEAMAERPAYEDGDVFDYVDRFQTVACKRWEVAKDDADGSWRSQCDGNVAYFSAATGALLRIAGKDGADLIKFQPYAPAIPFPLRVGSKWGGKFRLWTAGSVISPKLDESCEVVSYETVHVVAGDLPAFRFDCATTWSVWPLHGHVKVTSWYAPSAKVVVKSINGSDPKWNLELASYSLK